MAADRPRVQFSTRDLFEITFWIALGIGAIRAEFAFREGVIQEVNRLIYDLFVGFPFWAITGAAFGAAVGALFNRRSEMICWGMVVWPVLAVIAAGLS